jgi:hypothetical protein
MVHITKRQITRLIAAGVIAAAPATYVAGQSTDELSRGFGNTPQVVDKRLIYMDDGWKDAFVDARQPCRRQGKLHVGKQPAGQHHCRQHRRELCGKLREGTVKGEVQQGGMLKNVYSSRGVRLNYNDEGVR